MKRAERIYVEPMLFVVAGNHDDNVHASALSINLRAMEVRNIETPTHGRLLFEARDTGRIIVGFHGYGETAETHLELLRRLPGTDEWSLAALQALHPFYVTKTGAVVASWMTSLDRELAIADNIEYVKRALAALPPAQKLVFAGFSQGVAMAWRAAASIPSHGLIVLGSDVPPDVVAARPKLPPALLGRGTRDEWYSEAKFEKDVAFLRGVTEVTPCVFEGGHEWSDEFREAAGKFLARI